LGNPRAVHYNLSSHPANGGPAISDALSPLPSAPAALPALTPVERAEVTVAPADQESRIIVLTSVGHALCHMSELAFAGVLLALMAEFSLRPDQATLLGLTGYVLLGLGAIPTGLWTDRLGARQVLIVYYFWMAASALAVALTQSVWTLALALTSLGAAISLYHPAGLALITHGCPRRGRALGINGVAGNIGQATGPALGAVLAGMGHWRLAYVVIAVLSVLAGLAMILVPVDDRHGHHARQPGANGVPTPPAIDSRGLGVLFIAMLLGGLNYRCLVTALPSYLSEAGQLSGLELGGALTFVVLFVGGVGQYVGGHSADRYKPGRLYGFLILATVPLALVMAHTHIWSAAAAAGVLAMFLFAQQPVENSMMAHATSPRRRSTFFGIKFALTFGVGALGAQLVGFLWRETGSLAPVFDFFALSALVMAACAFAYRRLTARPSEDSPCPAAASSA
jgi:MFS family permease